MGWAEVYMYVDHKNGLTSWSQVDTSEAIFIASSRHINYKGLLVTSIRTSNGHVGKLILKMPLTLIMS